MKYLSLFLAASSVSAIKVESKGADYPGEPYRAPYLEHVTKELDEELETQLGAENVPEEMDHLLCMFETYAGTEEWEALGCDKWLEEGHEEEVEEEVEEVEEEPVPEPEPEPVYLLQTIAAGSTWAGFAEKGEHDLAYCRCHTEDFTEGISICNTGCGDPNQVCDDSFGCLDYELACDNTKCTCKPEGIATNTMTYE